MKTALSSPRRCAVLLLATVALAACTSAPTIRVNLSPTAQFANYRSYGFVAEPGTNRSGYSTPVTAYFKEAIAREMNARGYVLNEAAPDLLINFNANARENVDVQTRPGSLNMSFGMSYYSYRGGMYMVPRPMFTEPEVVTVRYQVGTANIDVVDATKKEVVWEGIAEGRLSDKAMKDPAPAIGAVVTEMFLKFPGRLIAP
jgi:hypothetical protein